MKKYEFVNVVFNNNYVANATMGEHRKIIADYAEKGYKYVGFVPTKQGPSGKIVEADLIFETEV